MDDLVDLSEAGPDEAKPLWRIKYGDYTYKLFDGQRAEVYKGNQLMPSYEIVDGICDCPSRMYSEKPCKHERPLEWLGESSSDVETDDSEDLNEWLS